MIRKIRKRVLEVEIGEVGKNQGTQGCAASDNIFRFISQGNRTLLRYKKRVPPVCFVLFKEYIN